ncbi:MAG: toll/interleukin-1 receptor domain-containing protein [Phycisphaeraceae bacterium]|nr:toll/interleukin-1 receptor domain-containing protein [Phycisphaeraceae bacterium]
MKVFVSHKQEDSAAATRVADRLRTNRADVYLDVIDTSKPRGEDLTEYLRERLAQCTHLMAVVSEVTKVSWWVPWEIGVATERRYPLATFAAGRCDLPEYLRKWPYLVSDSDIDTFVRVSRATESLVEHEVRYKTAEVARATYADRFFRDIRRALGQ